MTSPPRSSQMDAGVLPRYSYRLGSKAGKGTRGLRLNSTGADNWAGSIACIALISDYEAKYLQWVKRLIEQRRVAEMSDPRPPAAAENPQAATQPRQRNR